MFRNQKNLKNKREHYRLYKRGKQWVTAMITVATIGAAGLFASQVQAHADTTNDNSNNENAGNNHSIANSDATTVTTNAQSTTNTQNSNTDSTTSSQSSNPSSQSDNTNSATSTTNYSNNVSNATSNTTQSTSNISVTNAEVNVSSSNDNNSTSSSNTSDTEYDTTTLNTSDIQTASVDNNVALDASMLRDGDATSIAAGTWGTANWNLANDGTLTIENGDLQTPAHPQAMNDVASQVKYIKTINVKAPVFAGGLFAANKNGDFNGTFGNYATNSHPNGDGFVNVESIDVSGLDTSETTNMNRMFDTDDKLTTIYGLNKLNTDKVTDARFMFVGAQVQYLDLSNFNMKALTDTQKPLVSVVDANGNVTYTEDSPGWYGWDPQVGMFAGAKFGSVKVGVNNNIQTADFYTNNGDHLVDQNGNQITNNDQLLALANSANPTIYSSSIYSSLAGLIANIQGLQSSFVSRYTNGDGVASGASTAASMAQTAVGINPTDYSNQVSSFDSNATLQTLLAQSPMYRNVHVDTGNNDHDNEINNGAAYLQNSGASSLASLAQAQYANYKSATINGISSANSVIDSISSQAISYNSQAFTVANDTDKMANNFKFINQINKEKAVALTLQSDGATYLSQAQATLATGKSLVDANASASLAASQTDSNNEKSALDSAAQSAQNALNSAQNSAQNALTSLQNSANDNANSLTNSANSQANSLSSSAASQVASQSTADSQSADSRANSITQSIQSSANSQLASQSTTNSQSASSQAASITQSLQNSAASQLASQSTADSQSADSRANSISDSANAHLNSQSTADSQSADSRANSITQSLQSSAASHLASQSTTDSQSADSRANSINDSANSHLASQSTANSQSADSRANSLNDSANSHIASQSAADSQSADSRANSITQSLQSSAASHLASQSTTDSQSASSQAASITQSLQSSAASHLASQSAADSQSADSRANSLSSSAESRANSLTSSATSHVASQSTTDSQSADSRANSITQSLQSSAASHIASQSVTDSQSAQVVYNNLTNSAEIAINGLTNSANSMQKSMSDSATSQHASDTDSANNALNQQKAADSAAYQKLYRQLIDAQFKIKNLKQAEKDLANGYHPLIKLNQNAKLTNDNGTKKLKVRDNPILKLNSIKKSTNNRLNLTVTYHGQKYQMNTSRTGFTYAYYDESKISKQNPLKIKALQTIKEYKQTKFNHPVKTHKKNETLTVVKMANAKGIARFQLTNGHYVTANKYFVAIK